MFASDSLICKIKDLKTACSQQVTEKEWSELLTQPYFVPTDHTQSAPFLSNSVLQQEKAVKDGLSHQNKRQNSPEKVSILQVLDLNVCHEASEKQVYLFTPESGDSQESVSVVVKNIWYMGRDCSIICFNFAPDEESKE